MSDLQQNYDRALSRFETVSRKIQKSPEAAPVGFSQEAQYQSAYREFDKARKALLASGQWEGPIPVPLKKKYSS